MSRPRTIFLSGIFAAAVVTGVILMRRGPAHFAAPAAPVNGVKLFEQVRDSLALRYVDTLGEARLYQMAVDGLVSELGDPYSAFLPPDRLSRLAERTTGNYAGIGLRVDMRDGYVVVVNPLAGEPGERAGVLTGDRILKVDGKAVNGWTVDEVQRLLRGEPGSHVQLMIERPGSSTPLTFTLTRTAIHQSAVHLATMLPGSVGYVELRVFSDSTVRELQSAVDSLVRVGARALVIDVRANPGGFLEQGVGVSDLFLDVGKRIVSTRGRIPDANQVYTDKAPQVWPTLTLAVLVDDKTASAAELLAGALQDHDRAVIIGVPTYGKGSAQNVYPLDSAGALKLTTARWYTPVGRSISKITANTDDGGIRDTVAKSPAYKTDGGRVVLGGGGITPDVTVGDTVTLASDAAFVRAIGSKVGAFRDALASFALNAKTTKSISSTSFVVTQPMLDNVYARMTERGVSIPRTTYDEAAPLVRRLLSYEIARYVFGVNAEFQRKSTDDKMLIAAQRLLSGAKTQQDVFARATQIPHPPAAEQ
jgi:carboxyl-terminal processing protease